MPLVQYHGQPDPKYVELAGEASEGSIMPSTKLMVAQQLADHDPQKAVILDFIRGYKDTYHFDQQYPVNTHSGYAWDAIFLLANAMRRGTEPGATAAIEQTKGYVGISGIYSLMPKTTTALVPTAGHGQDREGQWVPSSHKPDCRKILVRSPIGSGTRCEKAQGRALRSAPRAIGGGAPAAELFRPHLLRQRQSVRTSGQRRGGGSRFRLSCAGALRSRDPLSKRR
jgi:hypothetical protein